VMYLCCAKPGRCTGEIIAVRALNAGDNYGLEKNQ
jgi:hypothetical protein